MIITAISLAFFFFLQNLILGFIFLFDVLLFPIYMLYILYMLYIHTEDCILT